MAMIVADHGYMASARLKVITVHIHDQPTNHTAIPRAMLLVGLGDMDKIKYFHSNTH